MLAVGGRPTPLPILAAVAGAHGVEVGGLPGYIAEAQERGVIGAGHGPPWFRHPLLAEVLYGGLPPGEAALIHTTYLEVAGRSNGEIAKDLVITDKTVSAHVSNILRKTGTASRLEAAALAVRLNGPGA